MKIKDLARTHGIDPNAFAAWVRSSNVPHRANLVGAVEIEDDHVVGALAAFGQFQEQERIRLEHERATRAAAEQVKGQALASMLITSGFNFDGFTITKYSGYISGDDVVEIPRGTAGFFSQATNVGASLMAALVQIRRNALIELKEAAYALGCNAVIGVDFDYLVLDPETASSGGGTMYLPYVFGVTANGNAVVIESTRRPAHAV